jgi:hypothetical protein
MQAEDAAGFGQGLVGIGGIGCVGPAPTRCTMHTLTAPASTTTSTAATATAATTATAAAAAAGGGGGGGGGYAAAHVLWPGNMLAPTVLGACRHSIVVIHSNMCEFGAN